MKYKLYEVGGKIRDELLGLTSKDVDYSVVVESSNNIDTVYFDFVQEITKQGYEIFLETPHCFTVRAMFPKNHVYSGVADFVLARKEEYYPSNGRTPVSKIGSLHDDLIRRDFTINALAKGEDGKIVDYFDGYSDLMIGLLRTPTDTYQSFNDDPLRVLRAIRFKITKNLMFHKDVRDTIVEMDIDKLSVVSEERIREELLKCFKFDTKLTINTLNYFQSHLNFPIYDYIFDNTNLWLEPTNKQ